LLPAGAIAGWDLHPLESAAFARRTPDQRTFQEASAYRKGANSRLVQRSKSYGAASPDPTEKEHKDCVQHGHNRMPANLPADRGLRAGYR
jgi:hypothetical protein